MIRNLVRIVRWAGPYRARLFWGCVCSFFMTWAVAAPVVLAAWLLAQVADDARGVSQLDPSWVWLSLLAMVGCVLARFAFSYGKNRLQESIGYEVAAQERIDLGNVLKRVPLGYFAQNKTGDILATATTELGVLELQGMKMVDAVINGYVNLAAIVWFLFVLSPPAALAAVAGTAVSCLALASVNRASQRLTPAAHKATEDLTSDIVEYVRGLGTAKSYGHGGAAERPIRATIQRLKDARIAIELAFTPRNVVHLVAFKLASVGVVACAAWPFARGAMPLWVFLALCAFSFTVFSGVERVNDSAHMLGDLGDILDRLEELEGAEFIDEGGRDIPLDGHDIEFENLGFSYARDGSGQTLHDVSFSIPEGTTCAIVGPSGSGKTTIASLMMRFWDADSGEVRVGGRNVKDFTCDSLLSNFSAVFQSVYLFNDTIENNIKFGRPDATHEEVVEAAKVANADCFIRECTDGYGTNIGDRGVKLSGGQRQRLSIARAVLKNPDILILDEATSALDTESEKLVQDALNNLLKGRTSVVIAHRLSTIHNADLIVVVDHGRIAEQGTHNELMERNGIYAKLIEMQSFD